MVNRCLERQPFQESGFHQWFFVERPVLTIVLIHPGLSKSDELQVVRVHRKPRLLSFHSPEISPLVFLSFWNQSVFIDSGRLPLLKTFMETRGI